MHPKSRKPTNRSFPASTFEDALVIAYTIQQIAAGQKVRRLTLFDHLGKSPDSGPSRQIITNSARYGLTTGSYKAEYLELTPNGRTATSQEVPPQDQLMARFKLAIEAIAPFKSLYDRFKGNKLPAQAVLRDALKDEGLKDEEVAECVDTFVINAKFLGLLKTMSGAERLLSIEHISDEVSRAVQVDSGISGMPRVELPFVVLPTDHKPAHLDTDSWAKICFYITPIGDADSEHRKHSDLFLNHIVEPALEEFGLKVVRADHIGKPGMITSQVIEHVIKSRLVVADLSFHNPNVFYELCLRHATGLPIVQVIRAFDRIPFDINQFRTIEVDTSSIYTLVPQLEIYRSQIANQARRAMNDQEGVDNPLTVFCPGLVITLPTNSAIAIKQN